MLDRIIRAYAAVFLLAVYIIILSLIAVVICGG
jgi:hypothetical protein